MARAVRMIGIAIAIVTSACGASHDHAADAGDEHLDGGPACGALGRVCTTDTECGAELTCAPFGAEALCVRRDLVDARECDADRDCGAEELCEWGTGIVPDGHCIDRVDLACLCEGSAPTLARCDDL